jgi:hypothetical protein
VHIKCISICSTYEKPSKNKALVNSKIQFLIQKFFFLISAQPTLRPTWPLSLASPLAAPPPQAETIPAGPSNPRVGRVFAGNTSSLLDRAFRAGSLSLVSLTTGPRLSAPSPTSSRTSLPAPPPIPGHRAPPSSVPRVLPSRYHLAFISPPLISLLNLSSSRPSSMVLKPLTPALTAPATPPRRSTDPYKRRAPPPELTAPLPASLHFSPHSSLPVIERHRLPLLHRRHPNSSAPPVLR